MYLKRSFAIFFNKFNLVFKLLFYIAVVIIIMAAIAVSIFLPAYNNLINEIEDTGIILNVKTAANLLVRGDFEEYSEAYEALETSYYDVVELIKSNLNRLLWLYIMLISIGVITKYLISLSYIPFVDVVNKYMHSDIDAGVLHNFVENFKKSSLYSLFDVLIMAPIDIGIISLIFTILSGITTILGIFSMPFIVALAIFIFMLRVNLFAGWIPAIVYMKMPILKALGHSFKTAGVRLKNTYMNYVMIGLFSISFYFLFGLSTLGLGYIIGIPMITLYFRVLDLVTYYNINGHRYYLDHDTVVEPRV